MADISTYITHINIAIVCTGLVLLAILFWYLRKYLSKPRPPVELELYIIGATPPPVRNMMEEFNSRLETYKEKDHQVRGRLQILENLDLESMPPAEVLDLANQDERANLLSVLPELPLSACSNQEIVDAIRKAGSHSIATGIRKLGKGEKYVPYLEVTRDVAQKVGAKITKQMTMHELEKMVIVKVFDTVLENCSPEKRDALLKDLESQHAKTYIGPTVAAGTLTLANLSGFGLYLASKASLIAIATSFGFAVPAYASVVSILSVAVGPVGWSALAVLFAYKIGGPDFKKTVPGVMMIASVRARQIAERDAEIHRLKDTLSGELATERSSLEMLRSQIHELTVELSNKRTR